ncbi:MAG: hypothetical protein ACK526_09040 [Planctomyces sp.]
MKTLKSDSQKLLTDISVLEKQVADYQSILNSGAILDTVVLTESRNTLVQDQTNAEVTLQRLNQKKSAANAGLTKILQAARNQSAEVQQIKDMTEQNRILKEKIEQLRSGQRVIYNAHSGSTDRCWLVELSAETRIEAALIGERGPPQKFPNTETLGKWMTSQRQSGDVFMLLLKPDAADVFDRLTEELKGQSIPFGFDLIPQDVQAIDSALGAAGI